MKITNCKVNHMDHPLGYAMEQPRFSWLIEDAGGSCMEAARIQVWEEGTLCHDSGMSENLDYMGYTAPIELEPRTRYTWQVTARTDLGEEAESGIHWFETGKMDEAWTGHWITCDRGSRMPVFQKRLPVSKEISRARLYICGLGLYEAYLTETEAQALHADSRIGKELFTPYCNNYKDWLQYQTYDITEALKTRPVLQVHLGVGWYMGRFGFFCPSDEDAYYGRNFRLMAEIHVDYADGSHEVFATDESWQVWRSNITFTNIYDGEHRDDTLPEVPLEPVQTVTESVPPLTDRYSVPVRVQEEVKPIALLHTPKKELVLDLGQNLTGTFRLGFFAPKGQEIRLQFGEVLQEDRFYNENLRSAKAEYRYISDGVQREISPAFTFYGYRYVKVEGIDNLHPEDFTALVVHSDMAQIGHLTTGNEKINRLISNAHWGLKGNFLDVPTDCPQRDERMGWTGDAQVFTPTALYFRDAYAFYRKYLHDLHTEQQALRGKVPNVVPSFGYHATACVWGDAATIMPWAVYQFTGDTAILREQYESMKAWVDYITRIDGENQGWKQVFHFGDWLALDHPDHRADQVLGGTDEGYIAYVYYGHSAGLVAEAAKVLGYQADAEHYRVLKEKIYASIRYEYFTPMGKCCVDTQTGLLLALKFGLAEHPNVVIRQLKKRFEQVGNKLQTGFVGTSMLCNTLTESGMERLAYDLLFNEEYPGWLYEINLGATTVWERWNSIGPDGKISSTGMNSLNHYSYGAVAEWIFRHCAGLSPVEPGFRKVRIAPIYDLRLGSAALIYQSAAGTYRVSWKLETARRVKLEVEVPFGCEAELKLYLAPESLCDGPVCLGPGKYSWTYRTTAPLKRVYTVDDKAWELLAAPETAPVLAEHGVTGQSIAPQHLMDSLRQCGGSPETLVTVEAVQAIEQALQAIAEAE